MMSSISWFDRINVVVFPDPNIFLCIPVSAADAAAVNSKGINILLANGLITFDNKGNSVFSYGPKNLPKILPDCIILDNWVFDNLILADELLERFETCVLVNNNWWAKLPSLSPIIFDDNLNATSVLFFIADLNLLNCELDNFTFKLLYCVILY